MYPNNNLTALNMITKKECLVWMSYDENDCKQLSVASLDNKLNLALVISQGGAGAVSSKPSLAQIGLSFTNIECGVGHLIKSVESALPYEATNIKMGDLGMDNGRIDCLYPESFIVDNQEGDFLSANGTYKMTTKFYNNKPTYTNGNGWWITWNGTDWSMTDRFPPNFNKEVKNESSEPNQGGWNSGNSGPQEPMPTPTPTCQTEIILPASSSISTYYDVTRTYEKGDPSVSLGNGTSRGADLIRSDQTATSHYLIQYNFCEPTTIYGYEIFGLFMTGFPWWSYQSATFKLRITNGDDTWEDIAEFTTNDQYLDVNEETTFTATRVAIYAASFGQRGYSWLDYFKLHTEPIGSQGPVGSYSIFGDAFVNGYDTTTMFFRIEKSSNIGVGDVVIVNDVNFKYEYCGIYQPTIDLNGTTGEVTKVTEDGDYIDIEFLHNQDVISNCAGIYSSGGTITLQN